MDTALSEGLVIEMITVISKNSDENFATETGWSFTLGGRRGGGVGVGLARSLPPGPSCVWAGVGVSKAVGSPGCCLWQADGWGENGFQPRGRRWQGNYRKQSRRR